MFLYYSFYGQWVNRRIEIPFAVIAIFFAVRLNKAKLPEWVDWILVAYVVFHILTHLVLTVRMIFRYSYKAAFPAHPLELCKRRWLLLSIHSVSRFVL